MPDPRYSARRATLDDLEGLRGLLDSAGGAVAGWEQRLTEFQLVSLPDGRVVAALALRIDSRQGWVHTEAWSADPAFVAAEIEALRRLLVERVESVARNHGLTRLWTRLSHPAYCEAGFQPAETSELERLPAAFTAPGGPWYVRRLKEDVQPALSLEQEMDLFFKSQREANQQLLERARVFKVLAWVLLIGFLAATVALIVWAIRSQSLRPPG